MLFMECEAVRFGIPENIVVIEGKAVNVPLKLVVVVPHNLVNKPPTVKEFV